MLKKISAKKFVKVTSKEKIEAIKEKALLLASSNLFLFYAWFVIYSFTIIFILYIGKIML